MQPLITVCLPNLNKVRFIDERIDSIKAQTYRNWECVICDSYSEDGSFEKLEKWSGTDPRVRLFSAPKDGIYQAWNRCIEAAAGEFVYIATSDDSMQPDCLERAVSALLANPQADWCHFPVQIIDETSNPAPSPLRSAPLSDYYGDWMSQPHLRSGIRERERMFCAGSIYLSVTGMLFRNQIDLRFPTSYEEMGDYFFYLQAVGDKTVLYLPEALASWRVYRDQATLPAEPRLRKQLTFLRELIERSCSSDRAKLLQMYKIREYICRKRIAKASGGKLRLLPVMLGSGFGRRELMLRLSGVSSEAKLVESLVPKDDLRKASV